MAAAAAPGMILYSEGKLNLDGSFASGLGILAVIIGSLFILSGLYLMARTISLFARVGKGTLAPWMPTQHLVVQGIYRHLRNPMISGVFGILLGESVLFRSWTLLGWFILFVLLNIIYLPAFEEPGLVRRFGEEYSNYRKNVPRWLPRLKPWQPGPGPDATA